MGFLKIKNQVYMWRLIVSISVASVLALCSSSNTLATSEIELESVFPAIDVAVGQVHSCALVADGSIVCWGNNGFGQLGDGTYENSDVPVKVNTPSSLMRFTQLALGFFHSCAVQSNGRAFCWGNGDDGQLGNGESSSQLDMVETSSFGSLSGSTVTQISAGSKHTCALSGAGLVSCWGDNQYGQLGTGDNNSTNVPVLVEGALVGRYAIEIMAGAYHTCALVDGGDVYCWGRNEYGELGIGTFGDGANENSPQLVSGRVLGSLANEPVVSLAPGGSHTCAIVGNRTVNCWGRNNYGQLAAATGNTSYPWYTIGSINVGNVKQLVSGILASCAVFANGNVECWGANTAGVLGLNPDLEGQRTSPTLISGGALTGKHVTKVALKGTHACALLSDGEIACWGLNDFGQLGNGLSGEGSYLASSTPVAVLGESVSRNLVTDIGVGEDHTCALSATGQVSCWGSNTDHVLGLSGYVYTSFPTEFVDSGALSGETVTQIAVGAAHTCALTADGDVVCWGSNTFGQIGDGSVIAPPSPTLIDGGALAGVDVLQISAGARHTCALLGNGSLSCWGNNANGELGVGDTDPRLTPTLVPMDSITVGSSPYIHQVSVGVNHTCMTSVSGALACWGAEIVNGNGNQDTDTPLLVTDSDLGLHTDSVALGYSHTCAIGEGSACWGYNDHGQLGADSGLTFEPVSIDAPLRFQVIAAGEQHTCGIDDLGATYCWGENEYGQLGLNNFDDSPLASVIDSLTDGIKLKSISASGLSQHVCGVGDNGSAWCWGNNQYGQLGIAATTASVPAPYAVLLQESPEPTTDPTINGQPRVGRALLINEGVWSGQPSPVLTYQWYRCRNAVPAVTQVLPENCTAIADATDLQITLARQQAGKYVMAGVTATSAGSPSTTWFTASTDSQISMRALATKKPTVAGVATVGNSLTVRKGTWVGSPRPTFKYQWYACGTKVLVPVQNLPRWTCAKLHGKTQPRLLLTNSHRGKYITVSVTAQSVGTTSTRWFAKSTQISVR